MDRDIFPLRSFDNLFHGHRDTIMGYEGGHRGGLCNGLIVSKPDSPFLKRWLNLYNDFDDSNWNYHSVVLPRKLAEQYPDELCELSPTAFFWPLWTVSHLEYMHTELEYDVARELEGLIQTNGGGLYENQMAYHSWSHGASQWLPYLTEEKIKKIDTPFNLLIRRFLK